jgi:TRAP transporter 4TM/12TM fusion protein
MKKSIKYILAAIAIPLTLYQLLIGYFGTPLSLIHRPMSVAAIMIILFLTINAKGEKGKGAGWFDYVLAMVAAASCLYIVINVDWILTRFMYITDVKTIEVVFGGLFILLVLEAGRRSIGWILPAIAGMCLLYAFFGSHLPGPLRHMGFSIPNIIEQLYMSTEGIWGIPTHAAVTFVFMFVIFGEVLNATGMGQFFMDLAMSLAGRYAGGPAKVAVSSSAMMGMIQGSSISNVVTTGTFTIPLMKRYGFPSTFAGAVEAVASSGGQITPPVMGAAAFIMADLTGIPYIQVVKHAIIPALLYYTCVFTQVHMRAKKLDLTGLPASQLPNLWAVLKKQGALLLPIIIIVVLMFKGYSPMRAGFVAIVITLILAFLMSPVKKQILPIIVGIGKNAPKQMLAVVAAVLNAGIIIGVLFMTGLGLRLSSIIVDISQGVLLFGLILTMLFAIILGMGMPTSGAYIIMGTLLAPSLVKMGLSVLQAHMFVLYFASMSMITPPVAIASYAAAGIADANPQKVGFAAWKLGLAAFIVPYMFAYGPQLLLMGNLSSAIIPIITAIIGCICLSFGLEGYILTRATFYERIGLFAVALLLIYPGMLSDVAGAAILCLIGVSQFVRRNRANAQPPQAEGV